jgi:D-methionine transport system substrate-binding protein
MKKKLLAAVMAAAMLAALATGCGSKTESAKSSASSSKEKTTITLGIRSDGVDQAELLRAPLKKMGYTLKVVTFEDSIQPNVALTQKKIDCNWYQHEPYLKSYNKSNGTDLVMAQPCDHYPLFAMYSSKCEKVADLPDGAKIGLCNDATNEARGLNLLASQKLITLADGVDTPTIYDVKENPHNFKFVETEMTQLASNIDQYDAIVLAAAHMANAGKDATKYVCQSDDGKDYAVGFAVRKGDENTKWIKAIIKSAQTEKMANYFKTEKQGTLIPMWK